MFGESVDLNFFNQIVSDIPGHIYIKDLNGAIVACSEQQAKSLGFASSAELLGKTDFDITTKEIATKIQETDLKVIAAEQTLTEEETLVDSSGFKLSFISSKKPFKDQTGKVIGIVGTSFDITAQKKIQALEQALEIAEERARVAALMASGIAHEMRTPMARIAMQTERLESQIKRLGLAQELQSIPAAIDQTLAHSRLIIDMLLVKAKLGKAKLKPFTQVSIANATQNALDLYPFKKGERDLVNLSLGQDFEFMGDEPYFHHLIFNLLKNALYAIQKGRKGKVSIILNQSSRKLIFEDTGCGISADILPKIFERFYTQSAHGTGVGLALCEQIMKDFKGSLACESKVNEFTRFTINFPHVKELK